MNENQDKIISHTLLGFSEENKLTEENIKNYVDTLSILYPVNDLEKAEIIKILHSKLQIKMDTGACVREKDHVTWYYTAKKDINFNYWKRYRDYLSSHMGLNGKVASTLDRSTDEILDMLGNPNLQSPFARKGLIIGDVQSGKTATYTALINKAADSGYKVIILLTGTIEKLRKQTQIRLDEGFVGLDSAAFTLNRGKIEIGVGNIDPSINAWALTSTSSDFNKQTATKVTGKLSDISVPVLFVLKKNKSVLEKLEQWLKNINSNNEGKIDMPMLLIDDEADNSSVNTKKEEDDPTAINKNIRKLLRLFSRHSYVAFTATPFANIFINPDSNDEMLKDDLFPKHFIYSLRPPTNYIGARTIFSKSGRDRYMLKEIDDCDLFLPMKHNKTFKPKDLPDTLKDAILSFFITNAIRDLRGDKTSHRSMLVNVSIFINVQEKLAELIDEYVRGFQVEVQNYHLLGDKALEYDSFKRLKNIYETHFATLKNNQEAFPNENMDFTWEDIQKALHQAIAPIIVNAVNGGNATKNLNYEECEESGLRLIAVGGYSLSRGLTLEGLCTSYFHRNSKMYDTLMQMGRWFGYRDGYKSLCQVWLSRDAISWYKYISEASDTLRNEVEKMRDAGRTPQDFGLAVRSDKDSLLVTAINKMRTAKNYMHPITINGKVIETPYLYMSHNILEKNYILTEKFLQNLEKDGFVPSTRDDLAKKNPQILDIPKSYIMEYLSLYNSHLANTHFNVEHLVDLIKNYNDGTVDNWDLIIAEGSGKQAKLHNIDISYVIRSFEVKEHLNIIQMSSRIRLGSIAFAKGGLSKEMVQEIEDEERKKNNGEEVKVFSQDIYFDSGKIRNPLLVIYPVELKQDEKYSEEKNSFAKGYQIPLIGLALGIPTITGREVKYQMYKINMVKYQELLNIDDDEYLETDETIE